MRRYTMAAAIAVLGISPIGAGLAQAGAGAGAGAAAAATATPCNIRSQAQSLGPSYVTSLTVAGGAGCAEARAVVRGYYRCRIRAGGVRGRCHVAVLGFRCAEQRMGISVQFNARVTCTRGRRRIVHTYTQNT
ncbi:MAG: hypothetical protein QOF77_1988 [Solirubrobacteraceae bacterium]|jgi:hypothetical protein|nr:hypothetical protein [Solirubrobacteraceae bacterium]